MIKALLSTVLLMAAPVYAKVDPNTPALVEAAREYATVIIDGPECAKSEYMGAFSLSARTIEICTGESYGPEDHDTIRHEVWHLVQHCVANQENRLEPVLPEEDLMPWVEAVLSRRRIEWISWNYPASHLLSELEAYTVAQTVSAEKIAEILTKACG